MRLRAQTLRITSLTLASSTGALYVTASSIVLRSFAGMDSLEPKRHESDVPKLLAVMDDLLAQGAH